MSRLKQWGGVVRVEETDGAALVPAVNLFAEVEATTPSKARRALSSLVKKVMKCGSRPVVLGISMLNEGAFVDPSILEYEMDGWIDEHGGVVDMNGEFVDTPVTTEPELPFIGGLPAFPAPTRVYTPAINPYLIFPFPDEVIEQSGNNIRTYDKGK